MHGRTWHAQQQVHELHFVSDKLALQFCVCLHTVTAMSVHADSTTATITPSGNPAMATHNRQSSQLTLPPSSSTSSSSGCAPSVSEGKGSSGMDSAISPLRSHMAIPPKLLSPYTADPNGCGGADITFSNYMKKLMAVVSHNPSTYTVHYTSTVPGSLQVKSNTMRKAGLKLYAHRHSWMHCTFVGDSKSHKQVAASKYSPATTVI